MNDSPSELRRSFLRLAFLSEGGLVLVAALIAWLSGVALQPLLNWNTFGAVVGLVTVAPMLWIMRFAVNIRKLVVEILGPSIAACRWYELLVVSALAGVGEELIFRGAIPLALERIVSWQVACVLTNIAFGIVHFVSWEYFAWATGVGFLFSALADGLGPRNLIAPMIAHGVYDFLAMRSLQKEILSTARSTS